MKRSRALLLVAGLLLGNAPGVFGQDAHEMTRTDKIELFLQHIAKVVQVSPDVYQSLLLEYELAQSITELGLAHPEPLLGEFVEIALKRLHPDFAEAVATYEAQPRDDAAPKFELLVAKRDPFLTARARLYLAEIELAGKRYGKAREIAQSLIDTERQHLLPDYRACEIVAECFRAANQTVLELLQYAILLTDYRGMPPQVEARAKQRIAAIQKESGSPTKVVANWMDEVETLIRTLETAKDPTQTKQGQILVALDKMVELQEARERNACPDCGAPG